MKFRAHRGLYHYYPENTMPAFAAALEQGYEQVETDPRPTKDGVLVLMHDATINRTLRNLDGTKPEKETAVCDITYEELIKYDAGIYLGEEFRGTKVTRFDELLAYYEGKDISVAIDKKTPIEKFDLVLDVCKKYKTNVTFSCESCELVEKILAVFPDAKFDYDGVVSDEALFEISRLVKRENLNIWMYLDKPNFAWLEDTRKVSHERMAIARKYASCVGVANVNFPCDVRAALAFCPDVVEV